MTTALVIGAGPAGLMAADALSQAEIDVTICDAMPSFGRKFLMAGKSGLNLTKDEPLDAFIARFGPLHPTMEAALRRFGPVEVMAWAEDLEQSIFTGSTGRVFPTAMKASPLLRAWLARLRAANVVFNSRWTWTGFQDGHSQFETPDGTKPIAADITILAMGGASWSKLGSTGAWAEHFDAVAPFKPANMGFQVAWSDHMTPFLGTPIKATALHAGRTSSRGEWVISRNGIEGGGVYDLSRKIRDGAPLHVDLFPDLSHQDVLSRVKKRRSKQSFPQFLKKTVRLSPIKTALFYEFTKGEDLNEAGKIADLLKALPVPILDPMPMDAAISTAGGLRISALDSHFMLRDQPGRFAAGEMLDWEAPTGGYLISGCLATGEAAARGALSWLKSI
ncbi:TIGR03862 family flavoprotein [Loktanella sp. F6476L]|uniref:TIGR03862 family flavoprotein n=1 Tax=Loktanella sp. F6476L TaxID=2926405 RepID=UPI001FF20D93|nr:TIGR03862 family flavoprotein [Loktanella sp. F6476L]MCK0120378.1 TIGR03862 family flavoprotein [Loktanella sp. F6476L]